MATRTWVGTTDTNWGTSTNWLELAVPTNADDVVITASPLNDITLNTSNRVCKSIDFTNFGTRTITFTNSLTVSGNVTLISTMVFAGSGTLVVNATSTMTSNGKTVGVPLQLNANATYTLADNWTVSGLVTIGGSSIAAVINGNTLNMGGGLNASATNSISGTTNLVFSGTGTWTGSGASIRNNLEFKAGAGTVTVSGTVYFGGGSNTLLYTSGTVTTTGSTLTIASGLTSVSTTFNCASITWNNITSVVTNTWTLSADINLTGTLTLGATSTTITINGNNVNVGGSLTINNTSAGVTGTTNIKLNGTGTWSMTGGTVSTNLEINTSGTITISGTVFYSTNIFKYVAGTVSSSSGNITFRTTTPTVTLNALFTFAGTITTQINTTFGGSAGFTITNFTCITAGVVNTFTFGNTYTGTGALTLTGTNASRVSFASSTGGSQVVFILQNTTSASQDVGYVNATDIDSSAGQTIWDFGGTLSNTSNWNSLTLPRARAFVSMN